MPYQPGLHILSEFNSAKIDLLSCSNNCRNLFNQLILDHSLQKVGEVYHDFDGGGFTAVVCLTESHISIHTWPEFGCATFDVFLSNYQHENDEKAKALHQEVVDFFDAKELRKTLLKR